ncbi:hypothetical protein [Bradyrhizobium elkanii]|uniref:hypothetical protein n=1 Tax=Bradyrhizobium elkanii TaxID=29448 RepID=UPI003D1A8692
MGEAEVTFHSLTNNLEKGAGDMDALTTNGNFEERPHSGRTLSDLIDSLIRHGWTAKAPSKPKRDRRLVKVKP